MCAKCDGLLKKLRLNSKKLIKKEKDLKRSVKRRRAGPCGPA